MRISAEKINWRVAAGEFFLIVIGILMALAIDSWADRREERAQADDYLRDLVIELRSDLEHLERNRKRIGLLIDSASHLLKVLEDTDVTADDPGGLLIGSLFGEGITRQSAIWEEIQMTGALRLIPDPTIRSAIVNHYLDRAGAFRTIDSNFTPASRALRALAWDVMPVESFRQYITARQSGVPASVVLARLQSRDDSAFLLKRLIMTATVARLNLQSTAQSTGELIDSIAAGSG